MRDRAATRVNALLRRIHDLPCEEHNSGQVLDEEEKGSIDRDWNGLRDPTAIEGHCRGRGGFGSGLVHANECLLNDPLDHHGLVRYPGETARERGPHAKIRERGREIQLCRLDLELGDRHLDARRGQPRRHLREPRARDLSAGGFELTGRGQDDRHPQLLVDVRQLYDRSIGVGLILQILR